MELGNLEMILRVSRWHGIAPYSSLSTLEVSRGYVVYGIVLAFIYNLPCVLGIIRDIYYVVWFNTRPESGRRAAGIGINTLSILIILQLILKAPRRLTHIEQSIKKLHQIIIKLNRKIGNGKGKYQYTIVCCILIQFGARVADCFINADYYTIYYDNIYSQIWIYLRIPLILYYNVVSIIIFQISCFTNTVLSTLVAINDQLEKLKLERRSLCQFYNSLQPKLAWSNRNSRFNASSKEHHTPVWCSLEEPVQFL